MQRLWVDTHFPAGESQLVVSKKKVAEVKEFLTAPGGRRLLLLKGPAGCGKASVLRALCADLGFELVEWSPASGKSALQPQALESNSKLLVRAMAPSGADFPGGLDLLALLNLTGPRSFLLQLEEELESFVRSNRLELELPSLSRRYEDLLVASAVRFGLSVRRGQAEGGRWRSLAKPSFVIQRGEEPTVLPKFSLAEFLRLQCLRSAPPSAVSGGPNGEQQGTAEEQMLSRLRLRLWAARRTCDQLERALAEAQEQMAPTVGASPEEPDGANIAEKVEAPWQKHRRAQGSAVKKAKNEHSTCAKDDPSAEVEAKVEPTKDEHLETSAVKAEEPGLGLAPPVEAPGVQELVAPKMEEAPPPPEVPATKLEHSATEVKVEAATVSKEEPAAEEPSDPASPGVKVRQEESEPLHEEEAPGVARICAVKEEPEHHDEAGETLEEPVMSPEEQDLREELRATFARSDAAVARWLAWASHGSESSDPEEATTGNRAAPCFRRFSSTAAPSKKFLRDDAENAPWPTAKLFRCTGPILWSRLVSGYVVRNPDAELARDLSVEVANQDLKACGTFSFRYMVP
eukprot:s277_g17.t3